MAPRTCPHCAAVIPWGVPQCPGCGAATVWRRWLANFGIFVGAGTVLALLVVLIWMAVQMVG